MSVYSLSVALTDGSWVLSKFRLVPNCPGAKLSGARMAQVVASWQAAGEDFFNLWGFFGPKGQKWGQIGAKFSVLNRWCQIVWCKNGWCQIVLTSNYLVPNCPSANLSWCQNIPDTKLSWPQTFFVLICLQSNRAGAKLSWYHIVLMPNCSCAILSGSKLSGCQTVLVPNWGKAFLISWGQIVMVPNCVVTNCPVAKFSWCQIFLSPNWCYIFMMPNWIGAKLSSTKLSCCQIVWCQMVWCQISLVPFLDYKANFPYNFFTQLIFLLLIQICNILLFYAS